MKLTKLIIVIIMLCGVIRTSNGELLNCKFVIFRHLYTCEVATLDNTNNTKVITGHSGVHDEHKTDKDVEAFFIHDKNCKNIPKNLGLLFEITYVDMYKISLVEIKFEDFKSMEKLRILSMNYNLIEEIPEGVFANNLQLKEIYLYGNKVKFLGSNLFHQLTKLNIMDLRENKCINKRYSGSTEINQLKNDIKMKCKNPCEDLIKTTQNQLNEMKKKQSEAKEDQLTIEQLVKENVALKKELSDTKIKLNSFTMNCDFTDTDGAYTCVSNQLPINNRNMKLNTVIGTHLIHKSNGDVTKLIITNTTTLFWTNDIFTTFPVLQILRIHNAKLQEFSNGDFSSATNLKSLDIKGNDMKSLSDEIFTGGTELEVIKMESNGIKKVGEKTFHGLTKLKFLSLKNNLIIDLHLDTFKDAGMLEHLILTQNKIQSLNGGLLKFNLELRTLTVDGNEVKEIGDDLLDYSVALELVNFSGNFCVDEDLEEWEIQEVKFVIKHCCKKPEEGVKGMYNCGHRGWSN